MMIFWIVVGVIVGACVGVCAGIIRAYMWSTPPVSGQTYKRVDRGLIERVRRAQRRVR